MTATAALRGAALQHVDDAAALVGSLCGLLAHHALTLRPPPPVPDTCCGRGCNGCVWEGYFEALIRWRDDACDLIDQRNPA